MKHSSGPRGFLRPCGGLEVDPRRLVARATGPAALDVTATTKMIVAGAAGAAAGTVATMTGRRTGMKSSPSVAVKAPMEEGAATVAALRKVETATARLIWMPRRKTGLSLTIPLLYLRRKEDKRDNEIVEKIAKPIKFPGRLKFSLPFLYFCCSHSAMLFVLRIFVCLRMC